MESAMLHRNVCCLLLIALSPVFARAATTAEGAYLRIETGTHTARIMRMATDAQSRYLVTAADDKTVRVWATDTGELLRVIRPPIGPGYEGMIWGLAVSPDGSTIACGGATGAEWDGENHVYLFDRASGAMVARLQGAPGQVNAIAWSADGASLAVGLSREGLMLFQGPSWRLAARDEDFEGAIWGADFTGTGNGTLLAVSSIDGSVRLYRTGGGRGLERVGRVVAGGGKQLFDAAFSPDGTRLAVGYFDACKVAVFSVEADRAPGLRFLFSPEMAPNDRGNFSRVCWSKDGKFLYAGGAAGYAKAGIWRYAIRRWSDAGRGAYTDVGVSDALLTQLVSLSNGGVAFSDTAPGIGVLGAKGDLARYRSASIANYFFIGPRFQVSEDATTVGLAFQRSGASPAWFSLPDRTLGDRPITSVRLFPPRIEGLPVSNWQRSSTPALAGKALDLNGDYSYCIAVDPDASSFVLGCEWSVQRFGKDGVRLWQLPAPASTWGVSFAAGGRIVVAAFGDGTIRWYRSTDGTELMSLFPCVDGSRWILWTPSGFYDCSAGAEDLIGWQVNTGPDAAGDFFPASRFRSARFRPDVLALVPQTLDQSEAEHRANAASGRRAAESITSQLPPVVRVLSPADGARAGEELAVRFSIRCPDNEPVTTIKVLVDGRPAYVERGLSLAPAKGSAEVGPLEVAIALPERDCIVSVVAENARTSSTPASVRVLRGRLVVPEEPFAVPPRLYVLAIGVSAYTDANLRLEFSAKDARDFARAVAVQKGLLFREVNARVLADEGATRDDILDGLEWIQKETTSKDVAMILLSGHGVNDPAGYYYYLPVNAELDRMKRTCVPFSDIKNTVASIAGKALFFIDTCHSGNVLGSRKGIVDITSVVNDLASAENGVVVFASSTGNQYSLEDKAWGNGAFTKALLEGLSGKADYRGKGVITVNMLDLWLSERVKELTDGRQTPTTAKPDTVQDFPVAVLK